MSPNNPDVEGKKKVMSTDVRYERGRWTTFAITWLIYASLYLTRKAFSVAKVAFADDPRVTMQRADYGLVDSAYLTTYALGQFIWGAAGDRIGPRRVLLFGLALSVLAATLSGFSTTLAAFVAFGILQGLAQSTGWSNAVKTMGSWFSLHERGTVMGWWCTHYTVGAAIALPLAGGLMEWFGRPRPADENGSSVIPYWPAGFWGTAGVLAGIFILAWWFLRNRPEDEGLPPIEEYHSDIEPAAVEEPNAKHWLETVSIVLRSSRIWLLAGSYFAIKLTRYALYFWGPKYISESVGEGDLGAWASAVTAAALPIGGALGVIVSGYVSDRCFDSRRAPVIVLSLLLTSAVMMLGLITIETPVLMGGFFFLIGFFLMGPDALISGTACMDFGTKHGTGTASGFVNGIGSVGAILGGYLPGILTTKTDWSIMFYIFVGGLLFSAFLSAFLWNVVPTDQSQDAE